MAGTAVGMAAGTGLAVVTGVAVVDEVDSVTKERESVNGYINQDKLTFCFSPSPWNFSSSSSLSSSFPPTPRLSLDTLSIINGFRGGGVDNGSRDGSCVALRVTRIHCYCRHVDEQLTFSGHSGSHALWFALKPILKLVGTFSTFEFGFPLTLKFPLT